MGRKLGAIAGSDEKVHLAMQGPPSEGLYAKARGGGDHAT
jgi:hypothetical protein